LIPNPARVAFTIPLIDLVVSRRLCELLLWLVNKAPSAILLVFRYSCKVLQVSGCKLISSLSSCPLPSIKAVLLTKSRSETSSLISSICLKPCKVNKTNIAFSLVVRGVLGSGLIFSIKVLISSSVSPSFLCFLLCLKVFIFWAISAGMAPCRLSSFKKTLAEVRYLFLVLTAKSVRSANSLLKSKKLLRLNPLPPIKSVNKPMRAL